MKHPFYSFAFFFLAVSTILISGIGCQPAQDSISSEFWGTRTYNQYQNGYFGFSVNIPEGWAVQDTAQSEAMARNMQQQLMGGDSAHAQTPLAAQLFTAYKYPVGASVEFNPSAQVLAERLDPQQGVADEMAYLAGVKRLLEDTPLDYTFPEEPYSTRLGNRDFTILEANLNLTDLLARQMYYVTIEKGYAVVFVLSFASRAQRNELEQTFLETIAF